MGIAALRTYRERHCLTLYQLGKQLGVAGNTVWRWEAGNRKPSVDAAIRIAAKTGIPLADLIGVHRKSLKN
jgi:transcriptional regulator with XRE-family HTH domain